MVKLKVVELRKLKVVSFTSQHAMEVPTRTELRKLKVVELKVVELRKRLVKASLPQGGECIILLSYSFKLVHGTAIEKFVTSSQMILKVQAMFFSWVICFMCLCILASG